MRFTPWALALSLCGAVLLTACGGKSGSSGSGSSASVRLLNATSSYASIDLTVDDTKHTSNVAFGKVGTYGNVDTSKTTSKVSDSSSSSTIATTAPTLAGNNSYTLIAFGFAGNTRTTLLQEEEAAADSGKAKLLVLNLSPDAGALDVYLTTPTESIDTATRQVANLQSGSGSGYVGMTSGSYRVRVTGYNQRGNDIRLDIPALTLASGGVHTLMLTGTEGGVLLNGITLVQKGEVAPVLNTQARVRGVVALNSGSSVSGTIGGQTIVPASVTPALGDYVTVAAGSATAQFAFNGTTLTSPAKTLVAGSDYTLLVWGDPANPQYTWNADNNKLASSTGNAKIRLLNGMGTAAGPLNMSVDFASVASSVAPGAISEFREITASTSAFLEVTKPGTVEPLYSRSPLTFLPLSNYTVFVMPGANGPVTTLRKER
jgi:Domain of unknown function (DUF4397)